MLCCYETVFGAPDQKNGCGSQRNHTGLVVFEIVSCIDHRAGECRSSFPAPNGREKPSVVVVRSAIKGAMRPPSHLHYHLRGKIHVEIEESHHGGTDPLFRANKA